MSKFDEAVAGYHKTMGDLGIAFDADLFTKVTKGLGPSIYLADASLVSCGDQSEKDRVKANFLIKKMELADGANLTAAVDKVCGQVSSLARKPRAIFYYLLVQELGLQGKYA
jgi:Protein of unknown function (DUF2853)